ncbi:MAG: LacI family transcriptional regulator [Clostridiales Family XIII bacterium]|jgi:LacI family transcriptional regulator|nr:LacI family transcriptional regulator [Clostridiales Family XIII bacterium]
MSGYDVSNNGANSESNARRGGKGAAPATIRDIARLCGVSSATVSYVLNDKYGVSDAVRARVKAVLDSEGYAQNLRAKGLKTRRSYAVHAVIRKEAAPACKAFYFGVIACIAERLSSALPESTYSVVPVFQSDDESDDTLSGLIRNGDTDGVIAFQGLMPNTVGALEGQGVPYVIINPGFEADPRAVSVKIDFEELSYRATSYIASLGHADIAFIGMRRLPFFFSATKRGFRRALRENGLTERREWIRGEADCAEGAADAMRRILTGGIKAERGMAREQERGMARAGAYPTAVFCTQDNFAFSAMSVARGFGYRVPEDISFVGIDDVPEAKYIEPALTTIPISPQTLADEAMGRLFAMIDGGQAKSVTVESMDVIERKSVCPREYMATSHAV